MLAPINRFRHSNPYLKDNDRQVAQAGGMAATLLSPADQLPISQDHHVRKSVTRNGKSRLFTVIFGTDGRPKIPAFNNVQVSTMTVIVYTNLIINIRNVLRYLPVTPWVIVKKKRGRKKKVQPEDPNKDVPPGSIISLKHKKEVRGAVLKPAKASSGDGEYWKHSVSVVMILEQLKMLNVKVSRNGKLQMTGCKCMKHAVDFVKHLYSLMIEAEEWSGETLFTYKADQNDQGKEEPNAPDSPSPEARPVTMKNVNLDNDGLVATFKCVMKNIDFDAGFKIRRNRLNTLINHHTDFRSIFESSIGTSVNIKLKAVHHSDPQIDRLRITGAGECFEDAIPYEEFVKSLSAKDQKEQLKKEAYHTFLVFASGSIIMSSAGREMEWIFYKLVRILVEYRSVLEEAAEDEEMDSQWLDEPVVATAQDPRKPPPTTKTDPRLAKELDRLIEVERQNHRSEPSRHPLVPFGEVGGRDGPMLRMYGPSMYGRPPA